MCVYGGYIDGYIDKSAKPYIPTKKGTLGWDYVCYYCRRLYYLVYNVHNEHFELLCMIPSSGI